VGECACACENARFEVYNDDSFDSAGKHQSRVYRARSTGRSCAHSPRHASTKGQQHNTHHRHVREGKQASAIALIMQAKRHLQTCASHSRESVDLNLVVVVDKHLQLTD
jgi:hypothetical protein